MNEELEHFYRDKVIDYTLEESKSFTNHMILCDTQKWLRDVHDIVVEARANSYFNKYKEIYQVNGYFNTILTISSTNYISKTSSIYDTYEEALEVGLIEALKLIKLDIVDKID